MMDGIATEPGRAHILDARDLELPRRAATPLRGLNLQVPRGEIVALLGSKGAGKSTLLAAFAGLLRLRRGEVFLDGFPITTVPPRGRMQRGLVLVPPGRAILGHMSVQENIRLGAHWRRRDRALRSDLAAVWARFPTLAEHRRAAAGGLSAADQQLLALARALLGQPRLLLVDEPFFGLAPQAVHQVVDVLTGLRSTGLTILLAEGNAAVALAIAQRGYILERGQVMAAGPAAELAADPAIRAAYFGGRGPKAP